MLVRGVRRNRWQLRVVVKVDISFFQQTLKDMNACVKRVNVFLWVGLALVIVKDKCALIAIKFTVQAPRFATITLERNSKR